MPRRFSTFVHATIASGALAIVAPAWAESIAELKAAAKRPPDDPGRALMLAQQLRRSGLNGEAIQVARAGFAKARGNDAIAGLRLEIARNHIALGDQKPALRECEQIHKLSPLVEQICIAEAQLLHRRGSVALPAAEEALKIAPRDYDALTAKGRALRQLGRPDEAVRTLNDAIAVDPGRHEARVALAEVHLDRSDKAKGVSVLREAHRRSPQEPDVLILLGTHLPSSQESIALLTKAIAMRPTAAQALARLGEVLLDMRDAEGAERALRGALAMDDRQAAWHASLGRVLLRRDQPKAALEEARKALKIVANDAGAKLVEANALAAQGDIDLAIVAYESAYGLARTSPEALVDAARACLEHGRPTTARAFADRATQEFPDWGPAWEISGDAASKENEIDAARRAYRKALTANGPVDKNAVKRKLAKLK